MGRKRKKKPKVFRDEKGEYRWETYFVRGKQKRRKVRMMDGEDFDFDRYVRENADDIWLVQNGLWEVIHEREMANSDKPDSMSPEHDDPF